MVGGSNLKWEKMNRDIMTAIKDRLSPVNSNTRVTYATIILPYDKEEKAVKSYTSYKLALTAHFGFRYKNLWLGARIFLK